MKIIQRAKYNRTDKVFYDLGVIDGVIYEVNIRKNKKAKGYTPWLGYERTLGKRIPLRKRYVR